MQYVSIYDKTGTTANQIKDISLWKEKRNFQLQEEIWNDDKNLFQNIQKAKPDILIMVIDNSNICRPEGIKNLKLNFTGLHIIVIGYNPEYQTVRQYFLNGAFDYLVQPIDLELLEQAVLRVYDSFGMNYVVNDLHMKIDAFVNNIFLGGGQEEIIIGSIIEQIYEDWDHDPINCQTISDKAKTYIYDILT